MDFYIPVIVQVQESPKDLLVVLKYPGVEVEETGSHT